QFSSSFDFIVTARPASVRFDNAAPHFTRWRILPLSSAHRTLLAHKYMESAVDVDRFLDLIKNNNLSDIMRTPLFEAIAASVFGKSGTLAGNKLELCNEFSFTLMEKAIHTTTAGYTALGHILSEIAADPKLDASALPRIETNIEILISPTPSRLRSYESLKELLIGTGIVRLSGDTFQFIH